MRLANLGAEHVDKKTAKIAETAQEVFWLYVMLESGEFVSFVTFRYVMLDFSKAQITGFFCSRSSFRQVMVVRVLLCPF